MRDRAGGSTAHEADSKAAHDEIRNDDGDRDGTHLGRRRRRSRTIDRRRNRMSEHTRTNVEGQESDRNRNRGRSNRDRGRSTNRERDMLENVRGRSSKRVCLSHLDHEYPDDLDNSVKLTGTIEEICQVTKLDSEEHQNEGVVESFFDSFEAEQVDNSSDYSGDAYYQDLSPQSQVENVRPRSLFRESEIASAADASVTATQQSSLLSNADGDDDEETDSLNGSCPICLQCSNNPSYLHPCYHLFCLECVRRWLDRVPLCPLCKVYVDFIVYDVNEEQRTFQKHYVGSEGGNKDGQKRSVRQERRNESNGFIRANRIEMQWGPRHGPVDVMQKRRRIYAKNLVPTNLPSHFSASLTIEPLHLDRLRPFLARELAVLLGDSCDDLVVEHMQAVLLMPHREGASWSTVGTFLRPWLGDRSRRFLEEIWRFLRSAKDLNGWDRLVVYGQA